MLAEWLGALPLSAFTGAYLRRLAWAAPGTAHRARSLLDWEVLNGVLGARPAPDVLVVAEGQLVPAPAPRDLRQLRALMDRGVGVVVREAERHDAGLAALARAFAADLPAEVHVQLFVTPANTYGFGWHYDLEDVFIAQTAGSKDYFFRENTVDLPPISRRPKLEFSAFARERSPLGTARLLPGDVLYLPARWWHYARCLESSLSISVGFIPRATLD